MMMKGLILVIQNVAIAYIDIWYPGQIISEENSNFTVKYLHPGSGKENAFKWPDIEDISVIDKCLYFLQILKFCLRILWEEHGISQHIQNLRSIICCIQKSFFNRMW